MSTSADFDRMVLEFMADDPLTAYVVRQDAGTYNTATGTYTAVDVSIPVSAILLDLTLSSNGLSVKPDSLIQAGDKLLFVQPPEKSDTLVLPLVINPASDKILIGTTKYNIVTVKEVNPSADNVILYQLVIRK